MATDLIVFGEDWGGLPSSTQHLVRALATERRVLWVDSIGLRQPRLRLADLGRLWRKLTASARPTAPQVGPSDKDGASFRVLHPLTIPAPRSRLARALAARLLQRQVGRAARAMGLSRPLLWLSLPTAVDLIGRLGEGQVLYYCGDDFGALAGVDHALVRARELELVARADHIITASVALARRFPTPRTHYLPHGVDHALFSTTTAPAPELALHHGPVAGFYGSLSEWVDWPMLKAVAQRLPHWRFQLIGRCEADLHGIEQLPNVELLGPRPHTQLPSYSQHWNAALLPFRDNAQIRACNPLKLREYLAAGTPVVTTDFPALAPYRDLVQVAEGATAYAIALEQVRYTSEAAREARRARVAGESWAARAHEIAALID